MPARRHDYLGLNRWYEYGGNYWNLTAAATGGLRNAAEHEGTRHHRAGSRRAADLLHVRPRRDVGAVDDDGFDDPYEFNLANPTAADQPFTVAELERILRPYDADAARLPGPAGRAGPQPVAAGESATPAGSDHRELGPALPERRCRDIWPIRSGPI